MSNETQTALLISLIVLVAVIAFIVWWYGIRRGGSSGEDNEGPSFQAPGYKDKLTLIDGIGETLQRKLNELGITSFKQIAEFTDEDIERVNRVLRFKGRIQRESWVAQARKLVEAASRPTDVRPAATVGAASGNKASGKKKKAAKAPARKKKAARKKAGPEGRKRVRKAAAGKAKKKSKKKTQGS